MWLDISLLSSSELLQIFCNFFEEEAFDNDIVVCIIKELVAGNIQQGELNSKRLFSFFSRRMEHIRSLQKFICSLFLYELLIAFFFF